MGLNGKLGLVVDHDQNTRLDAYLLFAGSQDRLSDRDVGDPRINPDGSPGWMTVNIMLSRKLNNFSIGVRLENLFDKSYREHGSGIDAPGRNIGAWISARF